VLYLADGISLRCAVLALTVFDGFSLLRSTWLRISLVWGLFLSEVICIRCGQWRWKSDNTSRLTEVKRKPAVSGGGSVKERDSNTADDHRPDALFVSGTIHYCASAPCPPAPTLAAINVVLDPPNCLLLLSYAVLTVTNICFSIPVACTPLIRNSACSLFGWECYLRTYVDGSPH